MMTKRSRRTRGTMTTMTKLTAKQLGEWIAQWESGPAREKHLFGFLEPDATADLAEYLVERLNKSSYITRKEAR